MKMLKVRIYIFIMITLLSETGWAHESQRGKAMATAGPYTYQTKTDIDDHSPVLGGFTLLAEGGVDKNGGVELGMTYLHKIYYRKSEGHIIAEKLKRMHMTVGYRHWFNSIFSMGLAYYSSYAMGDPSIIHNDFIGPPIYTSAHKVTETGFDISLQAEVYRTNRFTIVTDLRYSYSLSARSGEDADVMGIVIGYKREVDAN